MSLKQPFQFEFIRALCSHLPEEEIVAAEARFAHLLEVLRDVAADAETPSDENSRFDESGLAPHDVSLSNHGS